MYRLYCRIICKLRTMGWPVSDYYFLKALYFLTIGEKLNLKAPRKFNEKMQWLKLHDHNPIYHQMVDKEAVKSIVINKLGNQYVIPTLGVWDCFDDIDFNKLPNQFVLKTTNGGGGTGVVICKDKGSFDLDNARRKLSQSMNMDIYKLMGEWAYKGVRPQIIAEKYMEDESGYELKDYKFFCFNGRCEFFKVDFDRQKNHHANYFSKACELVPFGEVVCPPDYNRKLEIPTNIDEMINKAELIASSVNNAFVRVDLYNMNGHIYFGELTFYPGSGFGKFEPEEWDYKLGDLLKLPVVKHS